MIREFAFIETSTADDWEDWNSWNEHRFELSDGVLRLARETAPMFVSPTPVIKRLRTGVRVVDIDLDDCGIHYLLGTDGNVYRFDPTLDDPRSLPCIWRSGGTVSTPEALCVSDDTIYIAFSGLEDGSAQAGVYLISKHRRPTREMTDDQPGIPFEKPTRIITGQNEYDVFVLDEAAGTVTGLASDERIVVNGLRVPKDISRDEKGNLYVLDAEESDESKSTEAKLVLRRYDPATILESNDSVWPETTSTRIPSERATCIAAVGGNIVAIGIASDLSVPGERTLLRYHTGENSFTPVYSFKRSCIRLRHGYDISTSTRSGLYAIDDDEQTVYFLEETYKNKGDSTPGATTYTARIQNKFDSGITGMEWHRLRLQVDTAMPGTQIRVSYTATDDDEIRRADWTEAEQLNPRDVLLHHANGRYLWLSLELIGSEYTSPEVESVRVYLPRRSYLHHLPTLYGGDPTTGDFLRRFLAIFETAFAEFDDELAGFTQYLDPHGVPDESLPWLESWFAVTAEQSWSVEARRTFLERAPALYKKRGTRAGLRELLEIYLGQDGSSKRRRKREPFFSIVEYADLQCQTASGHDRGRFDTFADLLSSPREFLVLLDPAIDEETRRTIERIVDMEKPAHTAGRTISLQPWIRLDDHSYLGVNSRLPDREFIVGASTLGETTVLGKRGHAYSLSGNGSQTSA